MNTPPPKGGGFGIRLKAGLVRLRRTGRQLSLGDVEVVVRFRWRLVLDVVNPHLIGMAATLVHFHPSQSTPEAPRSHPPKGVGFPDPLAGDSKDVQVTLRRLGSRLSARLTLRRESVWIFFVVIVSAVGKGFLDGGLG